MMYANLVVSKLAKGMVLLVLMMHTIIYIFFPQPEERRVASNACGIHSYDEFLVKKLLNIPANTPGEETDNIERVWQVASVEDFYKKISCKDLNPVSALRQHVFMTYTDDNIPSLPSDVLYRPPRQV